ncbi:MAG: sigma-70 family RNA polymerase sigma factor [Prevotella sp.]|nr:sigma-70 family RNA polymerase sigma factor [Prevotella sp.]
MEQKEFETLIRRIRPHLYHEALRFLCDSDEAEDVTQDAVLKLWSMRQMLDEYHSVEALAVVMVRRLALTRKRAVSIPLADWQETEMSGNDTPETTLISHEEEAKLMRLIETLPDAQQAVLRMKHIDGLETSEIARITGCTEEAVRQNLSRARRRIMQLFIK